MSILMLVVAIVSSLFIVSWKWVYVNYFSKTVINAKLRRKIFSVKIIDIMKYLLLIILIATYFLVRWTPALINVIKYNLFNANPSEFRSANISILLMLDLCSFIGILLPVVMLFDKKNKITPSIALLAILGGFATIFFTIPEMYNNQIGWKSFFIGNLSIGDGSHDEPLMFTMHYWMICLGINTITWYCKIKLFDIIKVIALIIIYFLYIFTISRTLNIQTHVTAIVQGDLVKLNDSYYLSGKYYTSPSYSIFCEIFKTSSWEIGTVSAWISFTVITLLIAGIKNIFWLINNDKSIIVSEYEINKVNNQN